jgi:hypothetical protein
LLKLRKSTEILKHRKRRRKKCQGAKHAIKKNRRRMQKSCLSGLAGSALLVPGQQVLVRLAVQVLVTGYRTKT